ncbi:MAG TPA: hypothetical protein RMH99_30720 [Sandaracinaceae bacterium LLY-WYZ-13_1]|nr:hypothetical protein [Sandaracinaceae bacterium LLY-WYZ-13_1]
MKRGEAEGGGLLSRSLSLRAREHSDAIFPLVLEAFWEGRRAGAARLADELLCYLAGRLAEAERQYDALSAEQADAIAQAYGGGSQAPVVEAYFGATGAVLSGLCTEIRRVRPGRSTVARPRDPGEG